MTGWLAGWLAGWMAGWLAASRYSTHVAHRVGKAEVGDLQVALAVEEEVLGLEVAVADHVAVQVLHPRHELHEEPPRLHRRQAPIVYDVLEQLSP